jgi:Zn-dependent oligopeptidase
MHYITYLLLNQGQRFSASHLERAVNPPEFHSDNAFELLLMSPEQLREHGLDTWDSTHPEPVFDNHGKALLKAYCQKLTARIGELRARGDHAGVEQLMAELEDIETHLNKSTNHLGGSRTLPDETQREINRISKAISRAINKVSTHYQELGSHLEKAIKKGAFFSYEPDARTKWTLLK